MRVHTSACVRAYAHVSVCVRTHVSMCVCTRECVCVCARTLCVWVCVHERFAASKEMEVMSHSLTGESFPCACVCARVCVSLHG